MRVVIVFGIVAMSLTAFAGEQNGKPSDKGVQVKYDAKTFYDTTSYFGASFSGDEKRLLITSDASGVFNAYSLPVEGGEFKQLTDSKSSAIIGVSFFPHDDRILYTQDEGGNELNHLYVRETDGKVRDLTPGKSLKATFGGWSHDLKHFYVQTNERDPKFFDCYRHDTDGYVRTFFFKNTDGYGQIQVSQDGRHVALMKTRTNADNDIYLWDATAPDKAPVKITEHKGDVQHSINTFSPDSSTLFFGSDENNEFNRCWSYDLKSGKRKVVVEAKWDVMGVGFSWNGRYRTASVNADARTATTVLDTQTGKVVPLPKFASANVTGIGFARSEKLAAFYVNGDTAPSDLFVLDLETGKHKKLTSSLNPKVRQEDLVDSKVVRYPGIDKLEIPALLYRPHGASAQNKAPAMVYCHGGPGGQCRVGYDPVIQYLVNHGYAVLAVNNRGSSGYGKTFFHMDDRRHGDVDLKDVVSGRRYLETLDWVNGGKVGVIGGSYGGYLVCAALAFDPDAFDVGIDIFGVTNWVRTLESIPPWWASFRDALYAELGDPKTDRERLMSISPLFHAKNIKKPLLVVQGANDPRVLKVESDEIVKEVRANNVPVEYLVFSDEGHGFRKKDNRIQAAEAYRKFLDRHLTGR
ncbi:MAG: S9 family peptidase [Planctomycetes bacterium]|nr:S9 family peptidase [Planctomycetota bacterium]